MQIKIGQKNRISGTFIVIENSRERRLTITPIFYKAVYRKTKYLVLFIPSEYRRRFLIRIEVPKSSSTRFTLCCMSRGN